MAGCSGESIVTREEMQITFWLSAEEHDESLFIGSESDSNETKKSWRSEENPLEARIRISRSKVQET